MKILAVDVIDVVVLKEVTIDGSNIVAETARRPAMLGPRPEIKCACGHRLFDGLVIRSRVVRVTPRGECEALCKCKLWLPVPLIYDAALGQTCTLRQDRRRAVI